jgi:hypothetical protein
MNRRYVLHSTGLAGAATLLSEKKGLPIVLKNISKFVEALPKDAARTICTVTEIRNKMKTNRSLLKCN